MESVKNADGLTGAVVVRNGCKDFPRNVEQSAHFLPILIKRWLSVFEKSWLVCKQLMQQRAQSKGVMSLDFTIVLEEKITYSVGLVIWFLVYKEF